MTLYENRSVPGDVQDWTAVPLRELIRHLAVDDHNSIRAELVVIEQKLYTLLAEHGGEYPALTYLPTVFSAFCRELNLHMSQEEQELFPAILRYLDALEAGTPLKGSPLNAFGGPLRVMDHEHETTGTALRLFREFGQNYAAPGDASPEYREVMALLSRLEDSLLHHIYLENNVLYPQAAALKVSRTTGPNPGPAE